VLLYAALSEVNAAAALVLAAEGALDFREWSRSADLARYGLRVAQRRREREPQRRAELVLANSAAERVPEYQTIATERVHRTRLMVLDRLAKFRASAERPEARSGVRAELTKFTMSAR